MANRFKLQWSQVAVEAECERDVVHRRKEVYKARGNADKCVEQGRLVIINAMKCLYE